MAGSPSKRARGLSATRGGVHYPAPKLGGHRSRTHRPELTPQTPHQQDGVTTSPRPALSNRNDGSPEGNKGSDQYSQLVERFRRAICKIVPPAATVLVISKGDSSLLDLEDRRGWHFPQRTDGVYAGYYPVDDNTAIDHLEGLRSKGAEFLAVPQHCLWWLEYYTGFARHLVGRYRCVVDDPNTGVVFALANPSRTSEGPHGPFLIHALRARAAAQRPRVANMVDQELVGDMLKLVDHEFYSSQSGESFSSAEKALDHYLGYGYKQGLDPHPLFDTRWYLDTVPQARVAGTNPLVHFVQHSVREGLDPSPYFDTEFYYGQGNLRESGGNALVHYLTYSPTDLAYRPNPLFGGGYYLRTYPDVKAGGWAPLSHYVRHGASEGRYVSDAHENMMHGLRRASRDGLTRGNWRRGRVLLFGRGDETDKREDLVSVAEALLREHRLDPLLIFHRRGAPDGAVVDQLKALILEDYAMAFEIFRPSAQRLLAKTFAETRPLFAVSEVPEPLDVLPAAGVGTYYLPKPHGEVDPEGLRRACARAARIFIASPEELHALAAGLGHYPARVARRGDPPAGMLGTAARDFGLRDRFGRANASVTHKPTRKIIIPCSDWNVSGVNTALESVGQELIKLGWYVEIVFTRDESIVWKSIEATEHAPKLPYRFLERPRSGVDAMWEALIADLELNAPCIAFLGYDFIANSVAPALTEGVGVVSWVQADDGDYYEQAYRLGPYCNRVVGVSTRIRERIASLNPVVGARTRVIHNSNVSRQEVASRRPRRGDRLRLIYAGRLVQYQKRILDYVELANALEARSADFELTLIGSFAAREGVQDTFERRAADHIKAGRINLLGRLSRDRILEELSAHDFYVLLSDFEGMPLALIEAMARGCVPVVGPIASGIPELITDGEDGIILAHRDYATWAGTLVDLHAERRALAAMSRRARATVRRRLTSERTARQFHELFNEVADELFSGAYTRPPSLNWGGDRSPAGDVLPPPSLHRPAALRLPGLS